MLMKLKQKHCNRKPANPKGPDPESCWNPIMSIMHPAAFTDENLDGDWFVPGGTLGGTAVTDPFWKQVKERVLLPNSAHHSPCHPDPPETVTTKKVITWGVRAVDEHHRKAPSGSTGKQKDWDWAQRQYHSLTLSLFLNNYWLSDFKAQTCLALRKWPSETPAKCKTCWMCAASGNTSRTTSQATLAQGRSWTRLSPCGTLGT